jgi:peptide/nickel transport system permease protein
MAGRYIAGRIAQSVAVLFFVSVLTFLLIHAAPGGPAVLLAPEMTSEQIQQAQHTLGLDQPLPVQYARWLRTLLRGDLGTSYGTGLPVLQMLIGRLPATLELAGSGFALTVVAGMAIGIFSALRRGSVLDHLATGATFFGMSVPIFWFALMLIIAFSVVLHALPAGGAYTLGAPPSVGDRVAHLVLAAVVLATFNLAQIARYTRSSMLDVLNTDYLRTARAKGLAPKAVVYRHALRNALIPVVTVIALGIPRLVGGAAVTESIFAWPGMGQLAVDSALQRDYPMIMGITLMVSAVVVVTNLLTDLSYLVIDPRVKLT